MSYIDKEEYEERYGDHVGYCRVHHITVLDSCPYCEDENAIECPECHTEASNTNSTWTIVGDKTVLLCWDCADRIHKEYEGE